MKLETLLLFCLVAMIVYAPMMYAALRWLYR